MITASQYLAAVAINALWQVALLLAAATLGGRLMRRAPGTWQHRLWTLAAIACALLPWLTAPWPRADAAAGIPAPSAGSLWRGEWRIALDPWLQAALAGLLLAGAALRLLWIARAYATAHKLRREARSEPGPELAALVRRCRERLGLGAVEVRLSARVPGPATVGILHPVVILPDTLFERQGETVVEDALAHEMAHLRRRDGARKLAEEALLLLVPWPPMAAWLRERLDHTRELAADEAAAGSPDRGRRYSRSLLAIAADVAAGAHSAAGLCSMGRGGFEERVRQLISGARRPPAWRIAAAALVFGLALAAGAAATVNPGTGAKVRMVLPKQAHPLPPPPPPPPAPPKPMPRP